MKKYKGFISKEVYLQYLLKEREASIKYLQGMNVLALNEEIAKMAKMLKLDYYSL